MEQEKNALQQELEDISSSYAARFAGLPRNTRSLGLLDELIGRSAALVEKLKGAAAQDPGLAEAAEVAAKNLALYREERQHIVDAKGTGPDFEEAARLATLANFVFSRYQRCFAGQNRTTRDLGLLDEMIDDLKTIRRRLGELSGRSPSVSLQRDRQVVTENLAMYENERNEVVKAQYSGTPEAQASALAEQANGQFRLYRAHFAGRSRVSRRPQLLQRMVGNLRQVRERMVELKKRGLKASYNDDNINVVDQNLRMYEQELVEIRKERQQATLGQLMDVLAEAANEQFSEYRDNFAGQDRGKVDVELLSDICDRLGEVARQMNDMRRTERNENNERNLELVMDYLMIYEREWEEVRKLRGAQPQAEE